VERVSFELYTHLARRIPVELVALRRQSLLHLIWFIPYAFFKAFIYLVLRRVDGVFFADGVAAFLVPFLKRFGRARFVVTVHGLELTYSGVMAGGLIRRGVRSCDRVVAVSYSSAELVRRQGVAPERLTVIYSGVAPLTLSKAECRIRRQGFEARHGIRFGRDRLVLALGRLVARKGIVPFIEAGMSLLERDIKIIVAGTGPEEVRLHEQAQRQDIGDRLLPLGAVSEEDAAMLRQSADLFLFPNIHLADDVEGFGLAPVEALYAGTPVVAFAVDALTESLRQGAYLVEPGDYQGFVDRIHDFYRLSPAARQAKSDEAHAYVQREYAWEQAAERYLELFTD
jgi:phosphatidylinositol alpha-1,6-mannosyltransferase